MSGSVLEIIAEPSRQRILHLTWNKERGAGEIASEFQVSFGAVSQHLRVLREAGLVEVRKEGRNRYYRARKEALGPVASMLEAMWRERLNELKCHAEREERKKHGGGSSPDR